MKTFITKLASRKLITAIIGVILGIAMVFGIDEEAVSTITGAVVSLASIITYIFTEGKIDAAALEATVDLLDAIELILDEDDDDAVEG